MKKITLFIICLVAATSIYTQEQPEVWLPMPQIYESHFVQVNQKGTAVRIQGIGIDSIHLLVVMMNEENTTEDGDAYTSQLHTIVNNEMHTIAFPAGWQLSYNIEINDTYTIMKDLNLSYSQAKRIRPVLILALAEK